MLVNGTRYGLRHTVSLIPGDGVGKELCSAVQAVFAAQRVPIDWEEVQLSGLSSAGATSELTNAVDSMRRHRIGLKGIVYTAPTGPQASLNVALRRSLDLYANVVHINALPTMRRGTEPVRIALIRENTEGEYSGLEHSPVPGVVESLKVVTRAASERVIQFAFDYARALGRRRITCVHKANIMKRTDGLFLAVFRELARRNGAQLGSERVQGSTDSTATLVADDMIVDNAAMQMVSRPEQFDVIVTSNLYGNVLANIGAGIVGGAGFVPGYNIGARHVLYEPGARHVGRTLAGRGTANPLSMLLSATLMLQHLGLGADARAIYRAVLRVLAAGGHGTPDLPGAPTESTTAFVSAIISALPRPDAA